MKTILVTGGAGFVGSTLAIRFKEADPATRVVALDNLKRRGSDLNLGRLAGRGVEFAYGDVRARADLEAVGRFDLLIDCAAEPSVLAGYDGSPDYVIDSNLRGTLNCLELARRHDAAVVFLSTNRVYPWRALDGLACRETATRFVLEDGQSVAGASSAGICEDFPLTGPRSLYGATKLSCELILQEYVEMYGVKAIVNRCGVLAGAWQMGKTDQGVITLWVARHLFRRGLAYIGYGGRGKQVRDVLHVDDLYRLLEIQLRCIERLSGRVFNVGGGLEGSVSLCELTDLCRQATGARIDIASEPANRPADVRLYVSDCRRIGAETQWKPTIAVPAIVEEIARWIRDNRGMLEPVLNG